MKPSWISLSVMAVVLLLFAFYKTVVRDTKTFESFVDTAVGNSNTVITGSNVTVSAGSNVTVSAGSNSVINGISDVVVERTENLITSNIPVYLSTFDRDSLETLSKTVVWKNMGALRDDSNVQFKFITIPTVNVLDGILMNQELVGPNADKIANTLGAMSVSMIFRTNCILEAPGASNDIARINLLQMEANINNNIGLQISLTQSAIKEYMHLNIRWGEQIKIYTIPRMPLEFGYSLLTVSNNNATITPYMYSLSLDSIIPVVIEKDANTAGQTLSVSNRPLVLFKDCKGKGIHKLRMFMFSLQAMTETDVKLLATRYLEDVNSRYNQLKLDAEKKYQSAVGTIAEMKKEVEDAKICWKAYNPLPYMDMNFKRAGVSTEDELDVE